jgi:curli production assembly/transport component CsgF
MLRAIVFAAGIAAGSAIGTSAASELVYKPVNPTFGGDALNGNWLLSQATAQTKGGGSPGFSIDFPDFGGITQPDPNPTDLPPVNGDGTGN